MAIERLPDAERIRIVSCVQLLVEGKDAKNFFEAVRDHLQVRHVQIHNFGGTDELKQFLTTFVRGDGFPQVEKLAIVRDAEKLAAASALQRVKATVESVRANFSADIGANASWPEIEIYILPNNSSPGMLETLICESISDKAINKCIDEYFECVQQHTALKQPEKARTAAYIATSSRPTVSVGVAAKRSVWDLDHPAFEGIRSFISELTH